MFDLRYHVASLAAVFVALAVGIVIGVAIASGGEVDRETRDLLEQDRRDLRGQLDQARDNLDAARALGRADADFAEAVYRPLVEDRLTGERVGTIVLGERGGAADDVDDVLRLAGATGPSIVLSLPFGPDELDTLLLADPELAAFARSADRTALGVALGRELALLGEGPVLDGLQGLIAEQILGLAPQPLGAVVVLRTWVPEATGPPDPLPPDVEQNEAFLAGLLQGLREAGIPVVGVERLPDEPTMIDFYRTGGLSTVDDIDQFSGRAALALLLDGARPGQYGAKSSAANGALPPLPPLSLLPVDVG